MRSSLILTEFNFDTSCKSIQLKVPPTGRAASRLPGHWLNDKIKEVINDQGSAFPPYFKYLVVFNEAEDNCVPANLPTNTQVYSRSIILTNSGASVVASGTNPNPKVARIYVWSGI